MENELKEILEQLKSLTARVEALICACEADGPECSPTLQPVPAVSPADESNSAEIEVSEAVPSAISFTLNDRFRFQRVIFGNSAERMANAMTAIGAMTTADEDYTYLTNVLDQDVSNPDVDDFFRIVTLRFADHKPLIL